MDEIQACKWKRQSASNAGKRWNLKDTVPGSCTGWKATANWKEPITFARIVKGRRFFPLDVKLKLRADHWSEGAARVAVRHGLQAPSFEQAAEEYSDAVGGTMSGSSLRRVTPGGGGGSRPGPSRQVRRSGLDRSRSTGAAADARRIPRYT